MDAKQQGRIDYIVDIQDKVGPSILNKYPDAFSKRVITEIDVDEHIRKSRINLKTKSNALSRKQSLNLAKLAPN